MKFKYTLSTIISSILILFLEYTLQIQEYNFLITTFELSFYRVLCLIIIYPISIFLYYNVVSIVHNLYIKQNI